MDRTAVNTGEVSFTLEESDSRVKIRKNMYKYGKLENEEERLERRPVQLSK